jgi:hypothetical protein
LGEGLALTAFKKRVMAKTDGVARVSSIFTKAVRSVIITVISCWIAGTICQRASKEVRAKSEISVNLLLINDENLYTNV